MVSKMKQIMVVAMCCVALCMLLVGCGDSKAVKTIKTAYFFDYPNKTIGAAVDDFFISPEWESGKPVDAKYAGKTLVNCKGIITYDDEPVAALIQFVLDEKTGAFELNAFEMDGVPQNQYMQVQLLGAMFEE